MDRQKWCLVGTIAVSAILTGPPVVTAQEPATFQGLGFLSDSYRNSFAYSISADGRVVVGESKSDLGSEAFRWMQAEGMIGLGYVSGDPFSAANGVSDDGSIIVGGPFEAFRWTSESGMVGLESGLEGIEFSAAYDVAANGQVVVGIANAPSCCRAVRWTAESGGEYLQVGSNSVFDSHAKSVSDDGSIVTGRAIFQSGPVCCSTLVESAFRWSLEDGNTPLLDSSGNIIHSYSVGMSANGSVIVGSFYYPATGYDAFRWTQEGGMRMLGVSLESEYWGTAWGASSDGTVVVGEGPTDSGPGAFIWDTRHGVRNLKVLLEVDYGLNLKGWTSMGATGISNDGSTVIGVGTNPDGDREAWVATIPLFCVADTDDDGSVNVMDLLAVLSSWGTCDPLCPGDLNATGAINVTDLITLLSSWGGCPE
ncbi:MAG: PEP-CTERM sorting domain-containing protein [Planctomycetota bacterium]|nr:PEP-CTERM sorting domain-containing protein [Planctomycetota bacterium]